MTNFKIIITLSLFLLAASCKKGKNEAPEITIASPTANQAFTAGATVNVSGTATDDEALHEASVLVIAPANDTILKEYPTVHSEASYSFNYSITATNTGTYQVQVVFADHDGEETKKEVTFSVN